MTQRYASRNGAFRWLGALTVAATMVYAAAPPAAAQVEEGISLGLTPSAERLYWNDDLALDGAWYWGGRASLNFGRYVALEGYYMEGNEVERATTGAMLDDARRYGGDVVFTMADWGLTPFLRLGAGLSEFAVQEGATSEILTGTAAAGIRFDIFDRLQTQIFAQDVAFRASGSSPLIAADRVPEGETETLHNLALGAGINLFLGGRSEQSETDRAFEGGLRGVTSPLELYGGEVRWGDAMGLPDLSVAGARLGVDFGPYVGLRGYYFGSLENDLNDFTDFFGYGAEGRFNLTRSDEAFTPFLVLGGGRIHFPDTAASLAALDDDTKWNAIVGGGVGFNITERFRVEASARDMILSTIDPESVTAPDQLEHSWVYTAGLRISVGGDVGERDLPDLPGMRAQEQGEARTQPSASTADEELSNQLRELRAQVDSLRTELGEGEPVDRTARTFELPVLENGEIYVRFGESGTFEVADDDGQELRTLMMMQQLQALQAGVTETPRGLERDSLRARVRAMEDRLEERGVEPRADSVTDKDVERLQRRIDSLLDARTPESDPDARETERLRQIEERLERRIEELERRLEDRNRGTSEEVREPLPDVDEQVGQPSAQGVLQGAPFRLHQLSPFTGPGFGEPGQLHLGVKADVGSAFGGPGRFVPQLSFGVTDAFTWSANAHIEWPAPFRIGEAQPYVGAGLGLRDHDDLEVLLPNFVVGATFPVQEYHLFGAVQGLDAFDDTRLLIGFHTRPPFQN